ncbi:MAG: GAF domain-containing protein [Holophagaceae bacterium]|nr:GAF domain-containing protein [Holophagaceae bacterium]
MSPLFGPSQKEFQDIQSRLAQAEQERDIVRKEMAEIRELLHHLDQDKSLLLMALERLRPGMDHRVLADTLLELVFKPLNLASFYVAIADYHADTLHWVLYHEGGRARNTPSRSMTDAGGLTAKAILAHKPLYIRSLEEAKAEGAQFSEAERLSGLVPQTWYGIPMGWGERPFGLVSFQSFQPDAFSMDTKRLMDALANLLAMAMLMPMEVWKGEG